MKKAFLIGFVAAVAIVLAGWTLFDDARERREEIEQLAPLLLLDAGDTVADIGAGEGEYSLELSRIVGPQGQVYATEVDGEKMEAIRQAVKDAGATNVSTRLGNQTDTGLDPACCDAILLRTVYHHFSDPAAMNRRMLEALVPGGRLAVADFGPNTSLPMGSIPDNRTSHGVVPETILEEMTEAGFRLVRRIDGWQGKKNWFVLLFERPAP